MRLIGQEGQALWVCHPHEVGLQVPRLQLAWIGASVVILRARRRVFRHVLVVALPFSTGQRIPGESVATSSLEAHPVLRPNLLVQKQVRLDHARRVRREEMGGKLTCGAELRDQVKAGLRLRRQLVGENLQEVSDPAVAPLHLLQESERAVRRLALRVDVRPPGLTVRHGSCSVLTLLLWLELLRLPVDADVLDLLRRLRNVPTLFHL
mmetsp:Transcript_30898/g.91757  ORF Transcript_30898/g.91757 Transcript_30898/m.91757 type:complete len:208 (+) Transcript_30898:2187-2810(+)